MFTEGFSKEAFFMPPSVGFNPLRGLAYGSGSLKRVGKSLSGFASKQMAKGQQAYRSGVAGVNKAELGHGAQRARDAKGARDMEAFQAAHKAKHGVLPSGSDLTAKADEIAGRGRIDRATVLARHKRLQERKPSWAMRHPLMTAGAGALGYKMLAGGDQQQPSPPPQMMYPQQY